MEAISRSCLPEAAARTKRQRKATCCGVLGAASHRTTCSRSSAAKLTSGLILAMRTHISYWPQYVYLFMIHTTSMSSSHKYFFILQNQHVTDANLTSFYGPQKLSRKRHTLRGPTPTRSNVLRDHPLCDQESCLPELLCVLRIRFGRPSTVRRAGLGVLGTPDRLLSRVTGKPHLIGLPKDRRHNWPS